MRSGWVLVLAAALACAAADGHSAGGGGDGGGSGGGGGAAAATAAAAAEGAAAAAEGEERLADKVRAMVLHFQQEDPVGLPIAPVPDPMDIPDMKQSFSLATMTFKGVKMYGLSRFRIESVHMDLAELETAVAASIEQLDVMGRYTMSALFTRSQGNFTVQLRGVKIGGAARLAVQRSGQLQAQDINMDLSFADIDMEFENLGFMGSVFQGIINSVGTFLFDSIKPFVLREANRSVREEVNREVQKYPRTFPNSVPPLDMALADARRAVRERGYDPLLLPPRDFSAGLFSMRLSHVWLTGLATFYREGPVTAVMEKRVLTAAATVATQRLKGSCQWDAGLAGLASRAGRASFTVEWLRVSARVSQPMDTRRRATLDDLQLALGNVQARMDGAGTADYVIELVVNVLPNLLRYQIANALEEPLRRKVQEHLNKTDVAQLIEEHLPQIEANLAAAEEGPDVAPDLEPSTQRP